MEHITWILILYSVGMAAMLLEIFVPGAVIGITGFCLVAASVIYAAYSGQTVLAFILTGITLAMLPLFFLLWKNVIGRVLSLPETLKDFRPFASGYDELLGKQGVALSLLRPSGSALIEGRRYNVITRGEIIDKDAGVEVVDVSGTRLVVKRCPGKTAQSKKK